MIEGAPISEHPQVRHPLLKVHEAAQIDPEPTSRAPSLTDVGAVEHKPLSTDKSHALDHQGKERWQGAKGLRGSL